LVEDRPGHDRRYAMDSSRIKQELGWEPGVGLREGLQATVEWFLTNTEWTNAILEEKEYMAWIETNYGQRVGGE
jgi:dTDP-glucose 4,6-dehydratase